ncbi:disulfide isomerase, partial [Plectosphaerella plurivora]
PAEAEVKWSAYKHSSPAEVKKLLADRPFNLVACKNSLKIADTSQWESEVLEWEWPAIKKDVENVVSINCTAEPELCLEHDVRHFPTVRSYRNGQMFARYRGPHKAEAIGKFARRTTAHLVEGLTATDLEKYRTSDDVNFVLHLLPSDAGKGVYKRYHDLAQEFHDRFSFGIISRTEDGSASEEDGEPAPSVLHCYNNVEGKEATLNTFFDNSVGLRRFIESCGQPLVQQMGRLNANTFLEGDFPVLYYFDSEIPKREAFAEKLKDVARKYVDNIRIVTVDPMTFPEVVAKMTLQWEFPSMALQNPAAKTISLYSKGDIDEEIVERYIRDVLGLNPPQEEQVPEDEGVVLDE